MLPGIDRPPSFISRLLQEHRQREDENRMERWGEAWERYMGRKDNVLTVEAEDPDDNILIPFEQLIVNKGRSFLFGKGEIRFSVEQQNVEGSGLGQKGASRQTADGSSTMQKWLDELWKRNWKKTLLLKYATNGGVFGHAFMKIVNEAPYPKLVNLDPATVNVEWDQDDIEKVVKYEIMTNRQDEETGDEIVHLEVIEREEIEPTEADDERPPEVTKPRNENPAQTEAAKSPTRPADDEDSSRPPGAPEPPDVPVNLEVVPQPTVQWVITHYEADQDSDEWEKVEGPDIWPFPWSPVIDNQNLPVPNEYLGMADVEDAPVKMIRGLEKSLSNINRILRLHGHPVIFTIGLTTQETMQVEMSLNPDSILNLPNPQAQIGTLEMQSDLASSITFMLRLKEMIHEVTRLPEVAVGKTEDIGALSGVALEILYGPIQEQTDDKHCTYGDMLIELNRRLLDLGGFGYENWINIEWPVTIPRDQQAEGAILLQDKQLGASEKTLLEKRGYDPDKEAEQRKEEAERNLQLNMQQMGAEKAVAGDDEQDPRKKPPVGKTPTEAAKDAADATAGSQPGPTGFGRNARR